MLGWRTNKWLIGKFLAGQARPSATQNPRWKLKSNLKVDLTSVPVLQHSACTQHKHTPIITFKMPMKGKAQITCPKSHSYERTVRTRTQTLWPIPLNTKLTWQTFNSNRKGFLFDNFLQSTFQEVVTRHLTKSTFLVTESFRYYISEPRRVSFNGIYTISTLIFFL